MTAPEIIKLGHGSRLHVADHQLSWLPGAVQAVCGRYGLPHAVNQYDLAEGRRCQACQPDRRTNHGQ